MKKIFVGLLCASLLSGCALVERKDVGNGSQALAEVTASPGPEMLKLYVFPVKRDRHVAEGYHVDFPLRANSSSPLQYRD